MRLLLAATALAAALLTGAPAALGASIGANDDSAKHQPDGGLEMYTQMAELGLKQTVIGVRFLPSQPMLIQDKPQLDRVVPSALETGLDVVFAVYPYPPREIEAGLGSASLFGSYVGALASIYPEVKRFVIGNEPNQPAFWRPQFTRTGTNASAAAFGPYLAAAYDALDAVDPDITVVGIGLSPRGNDKPDAKSNILTSPVRFLRALGAWYRKSGRDRPLMDAFSFHPYPNKNTDPLERGYPWPNVGFANLDRMKQALWDAFHDTPQPTTLDGLRLHLDEIGWQVDTSGRPGYRGAENVPVTDELTQALIYGELIRRAACDPDVAEVSFFGFRDDGLRTGFQAAVYRADGSARPSADAVRLAVADIAAGCAGTPKPWQPVDDVVGALVEVGAQTPALSATVAAGEDARGTVCTTLLFAAGSDDAFARALGSLSTACQGVAVAGLRRTSVTLPAFTAGSDLEITVELRAEANESRRTLVTSTTRLR